MLKYEIKCLGAIVGKCDAPPYYASAIEEYSPEKNRALVQGEMTALRWAKVCGLYSPENSGYLCPSCALRLAKALRDFDPTPNETPEEE